MNPTDEQICNIANSVEFKNCKEIFAIKLKIKFGCSGTSIKESRLELINALISRDPHVFD